MKYSQLKKGKTYKLGDMNVGKFVKWDKQNNVLIFKGSQQGEMGNNEIDIDDEDDYEKIAPNAKKSLRKSKKGGNRKNKNKKTRRYTNGRIRV